MAEIIENQELANVANRQIHMANERTFLTWIRTSIGIMAFGFVVEKFTLFMRQIDSDTFQHSSILDALLTLAILAVGIFLVAYLIHSI
jgi:putative membrane protein